MNILIGIIPLISKGHRVFVSCVLATLHDDADLDQKSIGLSVRARSILQAKLVSGMVPWEHSYLLAGCTERQENLLSLRCWKALVRLSSSPAARVTAIAVAPGPSRFSDLNPIFRRFYLGRYSAVSTRSRAIIPAMICIDAPMAQARRIETAPR